MTREEIEVFIRKLRENITEDGALFEIRKEGPAPDDGFVRANKDGVIKVAVDLLEASLGFEQEINSGDKILSFNTKELQTNGELVIGYIEATHAKRNEQTIVQHAKESWQDIATKVGCLLAFVLVIVSVVIGFITIIKWAF